MPERMPEITARIERAIEDRVFPGCVVGIVRADGSRAAYPFGTLNYGAERVNEATVYDLASVTKSIPVASLALDLMSQGVFSLAHTAKMFLPELANDHGATVEDLLRYRVRGPRLSTLASQYATFEEIRTHVLERGFEGPPGESSYANAPAFILGLIIERAAGLSLAALAHRSFFGPLAMDQTTFFPSPSDCAPTEIDGRGEVRGLPHDESAYVFARSRRAAGHAGLFSTAGDLMTFLLALLSNALPHVADGAARGLGFAVAEPWFMGSDAQHRYGKTGFTGTSFVCDPVRGVGLILLSNRTYPHRPADAGSQASAMNVVRRDIADIVFA